MSNFSFSLKFANPWLLLLLIPLVGLALYPYLRLPKRRRRTRNRVVSLIIHILILALCVPLLAGMTFHTEEIITSFDVVIVADASSSNEGAQETMNKYIEEILNEENASGFNIGIVTFANDQIYVSEMNDDPDKVWNAYKDNNRKPDASATNIAEALYYAKDLLGELNNSRLILLSDGLETDGNASVAAKAIAEEGVRVYAIHLDHEILSDEVQVNLIEVGENAAIGGKTDVTVTLQSTRSGMIKLALYDNGDKCEEKTVTLNGGIEKTTFTHEFTQAGLHELSVRLESESDTLEQNNVSYASAYIDISSKVLVIDGTGKESNKIKDLLSEDFDITVTNAAQAPKTIAALKLYDEIILMNVNMSDLPDGYDGLLNTYVYENGGGLFTVGGQNTYALGNMAGTHFDDMLPIELDNDSEQVLELMLVMDISSSMDKTMANSKLKRFTVAKDGAIESVNTLKDSDYIGIVVFDENARVLTEISPATKRSSVIKQIESLKIGFGTQYGNALSTARTKLFESNNNADKQHVIFLTDGNPQDSGYESTIRSMASRGITVSTIAIYDPADPDLGDINALKSRVENMAKIGKGRCYTVTDAKELPEIMKKETQLSQREFINEETVYPEVKDYSPIIQGIDKLPALEGYLGVGAKDGATVVYTAGDAPIYAEWQYGNGSVGSFMSDLSGDWSRQFFADENGETFIRNVVNDLAESQKGMEVEFENNNFTTVVNVTRTAVVGNTMTANITFPNGEKTNVVMNVTGGEGYSGSFPTEIPGVYRVFIEEKDADGNIVETTEEFATFSYSEEYNAFADPLDGYKTLDEICKSGGGRIILPTEQLFSKESLAVSNDYDPSIPIIIIVLVLFLLDIAVRKFNFKWIHEIVRDHKEKKQRLS